MKNLVFVILMATAFIVSCSKDEGSDSVYKGKVRVIDKDIDVTTTWYADTVYIINDNDFWVEASLTIQAGTVIKFSSSGQFMTVSASGTVNATGTATDSIIFTSIKDDSYGGDNNGDGLGTTPLAGDWYRISLESNSNIFVFCKFLYGGGGTSYKSTLEILSNNCQVKNCTFANNRGGKFGDFYYGALDATEGETNTIIRENTFYNNIIPLSINSLIDLNNSNNFANPLNTTIKNTMNGIFVYDEGGIDKAVTWQETDVPYVINDNDLWIESGGSLALANNVILKFTPTSTIVVATGGAINNYSNCKFTSFKDDAKGGDTNGDGTATTAADGDWGGIYNDASSVYYAWAVIYYDETH